MRSRIMRILSDCLNQIDMKRKEEERDQSKFWFFLFCCLPVFVVELLKERAARRAMDCRVGARPSSCEWDDIGADLKAAERRSRRCSAPPRAATAAAAAACRQRWRALVVAVVG